MTSRRSWLLGLAVGTLISLHGVRFATAQSNLGNTGVPHSITYQGVLSDNGAPINGPHTFLVTYYDAAGNSLYSETFPNQIVNNGVFFISLGTSASGFPATMNFNQQYFVGISIDGQPELTPRSALGATPYAINAATVNGIPASASPTPGALFPLDSTGHISAAVLPPSSSSISTLDLVAPAPGSGDVEITAGQNIQIVPNILTHSLTISAAQSGISGVIAGKGLVGGGDSGLVTISLGNDPINGAQIVDGSITGQKLASSVAGTGLYRDGVGNLNVGVDNLTVEEFNNLLRVKAAGITANELAPLSVGTNALQDGSVTGPKVDPTSIQSRVRGTAAAGTFLQTIDQAGNVTTGTVQTDGTLSRSVTGTDVTLGLNLANANTWTGLQTFNSGATASSLTINNGLTVAGGSTVNFNSTRLTNVGAPTASSDAATKGYIDSAISTVTPLSGDVVGPTGSNAIATNATAGNHIIAAANMGTGVLNAANVAQNLTINGGTVDNSAIGTTTPSSATFTTLAVNTSATMGGNAITNVADPVNAQDAATKHYVDNSVGAVTLGGDVTGPVGSNSIAANATAGNDVIAAANMGSGVLNASNVAQNLTINGGTINASPISNSPISNSSIDGSVVGGTTAAAGTFTSLTGSNLQVTASADFGSNTINSVADPVAAQDAATKHYVDNTVGAITLSGDVTGAPGSNSIAANATSGNDVIAAANMGSGLLNAANVAKDLTINGGTINASPITNSSIDGSIVGGTTAAAGTFTTLTGSDLHVLGTSDFGSNIINNVGTPSVVTDAANKGYVDAQIGSITLAGDVSGAPGANAITANATSGNDVIAAANMGSGVLNAANVAQNLTINGGTVSNSTIDASSIGATTPASGTFTTLAVNTSASMGSNAINNVADPVAAQDAATKHYVDNSIGSITLAGDVTGAPGANSIATNATSGNDVIAAANMGSGVLNAANVAQNLTINGGTITASPFTGSTIDNSVIGGTTPAAGTFTSLTVNTSLSTSGNTINNVADPVAAQDAATKNYVDGHISGISLAGDVTGTPGANSINTTSSATGDNVIAATNMGTTTINAGRVAQDLTINGGAIDNTPIGAVTPSSGVFNTLSTSSLNMTGVVSMNSNFIHGLSDPTSAQDAATKIYVDNSIGGITLAGDVTGAPGSNTIAATLATGNDVIAATNAGTSTITAGRIAQNLTIDGGTVDNSAIGATTPSSATFTTLAVNTSASMGSNTINNVADPIAAQDAATKNYVDNTVGAISLSGDVTGAPGANSIAANATSGNDVIAAANMGSGVLNAANVAQNLTISGGTVDNSTIGATTPSSATFTTLAVNTSASMGSNTINNVADPVAAQDAATKNYVDNTVGAISLSGDVTGAPGSNSIAANATSGNDVIAAANMGSGVLNAANVAQNLTISGGTVDNSTIGATTPSSATFTTLAVNTSASMGSNTINNVADPVAAQDAATKNYVDNTVGAISLSGDVTGAPGANSIAANATSGNDVIAAANMGSGVLNAANVAQNLTISGGTVDNSTIGATTPSSATFTTLAVNTSASMGSNTINNVADPVASQDAATKNYVDNTVGAISLSGDVTGAPGSNSIAANATAGNDVIAAANMGSGVLNAANVAQNLTISGGTVDNSTIGATTPSSATFTTLAVNTSASMGSNTINNVADPVAAQDAATKNYVDNTVGAISLSGDVTGAPGSNSIAANATSGNDVIAAANMGSGVLNAANVAQNLTISGGTVDNSTIGATTPSSATFTTLAVNTSASMGSNTINNVADPVAAQDAATKNYVDNTVGAISLSGDVTGAPGANSIAANATSGNDVIAAANMGSGVLNAANVAQNLTISGGTVDNSTIGATTPSSATFTTLAVNTSASMGSNTINNVADPVAAQDAATKNYVDNSVGAISLSGDVTGAPGANSIAANATAGNDVIAAANMGSGVLNAANVAQNLTISGGTVDNSTIGATTPSSATFTTLAVNTSASMGSNTINNVADPVAAQDAATKNYVDNTVGAISLSGDVTGAPGSNSIAANATSGNDVIAAANMGSGVLNAANVAQNLTISGGTVDNSTIGATTPSSATFTTLVVNTSASMGSNTINNVADPVAAQDAATKNYVDNTVGAISLSGDVTGAPGANSIAANATAGNDVIAAANMGSGVLNAANVAQNLTISGGTVDNSTIGATTPSSATFTTLAVNTSASMGSNTINNVADPVAAQDAATKNYVDNTVGAISLSGDVTGAPGSNSIAANATSGNDVIAAANMGSGVLNAANVAENLMISGGSVDNSPIGAGTPSTGAFTTLAASGLNMSGAVNLGGQLINNMADPVSLQDAATKNYVDNSISLFSFGGDLTGNPSSAVIASTLNAGNDIVGAINLASTAINNGSINATFGAITGSTLNATTSSAGITIGSTALTSTASTSQTVSFPNATGTMPVMLATTGTLSGTTPVVISISGVVSSDHICVTRINPNASVSLGNITATAGSGTVTIVDDNAADVSTLDIIVFKQ